MGCSARKVTLQIQPKKSVAANAPERLNGNDNSQIVQSAPLATGEPSLRGKMWNPADRTGHAACAAHALRGAPPTWGDVADILHKILLVLEPASMYTRCTPRSMSKQYISLRAKSSAMQRWDTHVNYGLEILLDTSHYSDTSHVHVPQHHSAVFCRMAFFRVSNGPLRVCPLRPARPLVISIQ
jgi:hypothetical protein